MQIFWNPTTTLLGRMSRKAEERGYMTEERGYMTEECGYVEGKRSYIMQ